ncbi:NTP transferase domain-containing protein [Methanogenium organophilum]|uniref:NTP transferase domain-containing protein n=1 Tax=Methanogenium organophilum TaxID=2199 RepID=A0A9X9S3L8_METOG|nr:NTP transferase domain-containing protein [Methanogenium organophilum]WAI00885.1 NTP transferase domain-containing protein [Methanogenium organophilum]
MLALIVAGGRGTRLNRGEKPLLRVCDRPMIAYITDAFCAAGIEPLAVLSPSVPQTANWCRANGITTFRATGAGYVEDIMECIQTLELTEPVVTSVSDIPCITPEIITAVLDAYRKAGTDACSVWVPAALALGRGIIPAYLQQIEGADAVPCGLNILNGAKIGSEQKEVAILMDSSRLAVNVNTPEDIAAAEAILRSHQQ